MLAPLVFQTSRRCRGLTGGITALNVRNPADLVLGLFHHRGQFHVYLGVLGEVELHHRRLLHLAKAGDTDKFHVLFGQQVLLLVRVNYRFVVQPFGCDTLHHVTTVELHDILMGFTQTIGSEQVRERVLDLDKLVVEGELTEGETFIVKGVRPVPYEYPLFLLEVAVVNLTVAIWLLMPNLVEAEVSLVTGIWLVLVCHFPGQGFLFLQLVVTVQLVRVRCPDLGEEGTGLRDVICAALDGVG